VPRTTRAAHPEWAFIPNATFIVSLRDSEIRGQRSEVRGQRSEVT
jgi:hypothetical protein